MRRLLAVLFIALLVGTACGDGNGDGTADQGDATTTTDQGDATTTPDEPSCSAADLSADPVEQPELPDPVAIMRQQIINTATACNYDQLEELALEGDSQFTYSFGDGESPARFWRRGEQQAQEADDGRAPLKLMVELLNRPYAVNEPADETVYVWPSAFGYDSWDEVPEEDREALKPLYGEEDFEQFSRFGGYVGYRLGITAAGDWIFFVAGD